MKTAQRRLTYPELRMMPGIGERYELIDGELFLDGERVFLSPDHLVTEARMTPAPNVKHQRVLRRLFTKMNNHVEAHQLGEVFVAPVDVVFDENTTLQPDILFVSSARRGIIGPEYVLGPPDLVVEILSPYRVPHDRVTKFAQYAHYGVGEYWIVDPVAESVEVYRLAGSKYELTASLSGDQTLETPLLPGWQVIVRDLFAA